MKKLRISLANQINEFKLLSNFLCNSWSFYGNYAYETTDKIYNNLSIGGKLDIDLYDNLVSPISNIVFYKMKEDFFKI